jgi:hypothetical protein
MLNRAKLLQEMQHVSAQLFTDTHSELEEAYRVWKACAHDPLRSSKLKGLKTPWIMPSWSGLAAECVTISDQVSSYAVMAVDGSQIYPDRHQGVGCYLINVGSVKLHYGHALAGATEFTSTPLLFTMQDEDFGADSSTEVVNCKREEYELRAALEHGIALKHAIQDTPYLVLLDGSLIFWHLEAYDEAVKERFLSVYMHMLEQLYQHKIPVASYVSFPKSKELINIVRAALCNFVLEGCTAHARVEKVVDAQLVKCYLQPQQRTAIFENNAPISNAYPAHLKTHFFYLHVGEEIARVEIPAWVAQDQKILSSIETIILDQAQKGRGYPVCLAEAHEQAVVKGPDREFFYHLLQKMGIEQKQRYVISQKSLKKRGIGI